MNMKTTSKNHRDHEAGQANDEAGQAGAEVLAMGFILIIGLIFLGMNAWAVVDAKIRIAGAARYATRQIVESEPIDIEGAMGVSTITSENVGIEAVREALKDHPKLLDHIELTVDIPKGALRCSRVYVKVKAHVPSFGFAKIGAFTDGFTVSVNQSELVDPYRSGLDGEIKDTACEA
jgi:hypothetical protein